LNEASRWRLEMARKIAPAYMTNHKVQAVIVGGSAARGRADRYSDIEPGLFWTEPATPAELQAAMEQAQGTLWELDPMGDNRIYHPGLKWMDRTIAEME
jgi:hypothetical protein